MLQAIRVLPIASISRTSRRLYISNFPRLRTQTAKKSVRVKSSSPHLYIIRLSN
jgi:hypothetical protein